LRERRERFKKGTAEMNITNEKNKKQARPFVPIVPASAHDPELCGILEEWDCDECRVERYREALRRGQQMLAREAKGRWRNFVNALAEITGDDSREVEKMLDNRMARIAAAVFRQGGRK
jgi:hypothetical protein